jgi:hypothetical protein
MQGDDVATQRIVLELPQATFAKERPRPRATSCARNSAPTAPLSHAPTTRQAFYLVLADDWYGELAARPVGL